MKRLNKKGFTLIELLAVIVVLAIILVITIPTVLGSINNAKKEAFESSANVVADWIEKQYALYKLDSTNANEKFVNGGYVTAFENGDSINLSGDIFIAAGLNNKDYDETTSYTFISSSSGRVCVFLYRTNDGKFSSLVENSTKSSACD